MTSTDYTGTMECKRNFKLIKILENIIRLQIVHRIYTKIVYKEREVNKT